MLHALCLNLEIILYFFPAIKIVAHKAATRVNPKIFEYHVGVKLILLNGYKIIIDVINNKKTLNITVMPWEN